LPGLKEIKHAPILVVEDDENDALLIRRTLSSSGIPNPRVFVQSGQEAINYLVGVSPYSNRETFPLPALVLLDLKLPVMDGFEVLKWIRAHPHFKDLRVVVLTGANNIRDVNEAYHLGANSFLVKPLEFENIASLFGTIGAQLWKANNTSTLRQLPGRTANADDSVSSEPMPH
jgi:CheY-like chemotaxis protein